MTCAPFYILLILCNLAAEAQRPRFTWSADSEEGRLLQQASRESDEAKKIALFEQFLEAFPKHAGAFSAYAELLPLYLKSGRNDKALAGAESALAIDPYAAPLSYNGLQACEAKQDVKCIKAWSSRTVEIARLVLATAKPAEPEEAAEWARDADYATQVIERAEYSLYATGLQAKDPAVTIDMCETLMKRNPKSQYLPELVSRYLLALQSAGRGTEALEFGAREVEAKRASVETLLFLADATLKAGQFDQTIRYGGMVLKSNAVEARRGLAAWLAGAAYCGRSEWSECDKSMRAALPQAESNKDLLPGAYFYLGLSNFKMAEAPGADPARLADARKYMTLAAALPGPFQAQAQKNLASMNAGRK